MNTCQLNIIQRNRTRSRVFKYLVEYEDDVAYTDRNFTYDYTEDEVQFTHSDYDNLQQQTNIWVPVTNNRVRFIPKYVNLSSINLYFPQYSVETYIQNSIYSICISTFVAGKKVILGSYLIDRKSVLAAKAVKHYKDESYYEYVNLKFIDPWYLTYADEWDEFRKRVCGESTATNGTGSILNVELQPLEDLTSYYTKLRNYEGSYNSILLGSRDSDFLQGKMSLDAGKLTVSCILNQTYIQGEMYDLRTYLRETYNISSYDHINYDIVLKDKDDIYQHVSVNGDMRIQVDLSRDLTNVDSTWSITDWSYWKPGLSLSCIIRIMRDSEDEYFMIKANELSITQDDYKYFIQKSVPKSVILDYVDMYNYNVNIVNKVEKKVINIDRPEDYKANILKPIFIQTSAADSIIVHPLVTENLCINLNGFKSSVSTFYLKIEGVNFPEIGRTSTGVVFSVAGNKLPNEEPTGLFYVLNEDFELVTTGKYTYIQ